MVVIGRVEKLQEELGVALGKEHYSQALHCLDQMAEACPQVCGTLSVALCTVCTVDHSIKPNLNMRGI